MTVILTAVWVATPPPARPREFISLTGQDASSVGPPTDTIMTIGKVSRAEQNRDIRRSPKMRYRYLLVSLVGLLAGCQNCPLQCLKSRTADINDPWRELNWGTVRSLALLLWRWNSRRRRR